MEKFLVDTTVLVEHLRGNTSAFNFLQSKSPCISHVTIAELTQGTKDKKELKAVERLIKDLSAVPLNESISTLGLILMRRFFHSHSLGYLDALIAATALEGHLTLVTANTKHFLEIKTLSLLDWKKIG